MKPEEATADSSPSGKDIIIEKKNRSGIITLNRPGALNALTMDMLKEMDAFYVDCMEDPHIYGIVLQSNSDRAFSAGGDLRQNYEMMKTSAEHAMTYFAAEYQHNWTLERFNKPNIALMNGYVFGGGVGISLYGTHRVAGENYSFAMPETNIGVFPDIGSSFVLSRLPNHIGMYLGLTGASIGAADALKLKLISHYIPSEQYDTIRAAMVESDPIDPILEEMHQDPGAGELDKISGWISQCFSASSVEDILDKLDSLSGGAGDWGAETAALLRQRSPLSLKITFRHIREAQNDQTLKDTLKRDYRLMYRLTESGEFEEGVRALIIDKDKSPKWTHSAVSDISAAELEKFFAPLGDKELSLIDYNDEV